MDFAASRDPNLIIFSTGPLECLGAINYILAAIANLSTSPMKPHFGAFSLPMASKPQLFEEGKVKIDY
jgi:hypothetical protein